MKCLNIFYKCPNPLIGDEPHAGKDGGEDAASKLLVGAAGAAGDELPLETP